MKETMYTADSPIRKLILQHYLKLWRRMRGESKKGTVKTPRG